MRRLPPSSVQSPTQFQSTNYQNIIGFQRDNQYYNSMNSSTSKDGPIEITNESALFELFMRCAICLEMPKDTIACGHCNQQFCFLCIHRDKVARTRCCPVCRKLAMFPRIQRIVNNIAEHRGRIKSALAKMVESRQQTKKQLEETRAAQNLMILKNRRMRVIIKKQREKIQTLEEQLKKVQQERNKFEEYGFQIQKQYLQLVRLYGKEEVDPGSSVVILKEVEPRNQAILSQNQVPNFDCGQKQEERLMGSQSSSKAKFKRRRVYISCNK